MTDLTESRDPLDTLGEEFLVRLRGGERPDVSEFAARDPEHADEIREFLSALVLVEGLKPPADRTVDAFGRVGPGSGPGPERLGDFRILRELGRGGMGIVYEAEQQSLGRRVALKVLAPGMARTSQQVRRFLRESRAAARLHHTNIVPVFGVGEQDGLYYYAMQYIPGLGLEKVLEEVRRLRGGAPLTGYDAVSSTRADGGDDSPTPADPPGSTGPGEGASPLPWVVAASRPGPSTLAASTGSVDCYTRAVARIGLQVAEALDYAHRQGTLHRDVKPSNILLDLHGVAWVTDFGLAKAAEDEDLTRTGDVVGTIRYMAPERFQGRCDAASDVYGLGLVLYELLALRAAYDAPDRERLLYQVSHVEPPRLRALDPALPRDLGTVVHKAIEKDPSDRYATAGALADDLRRFLEDRPVRARRVGSTERLTRWARRNPGSATLGTALAGMLALVVVVIAASDLRLRGEHAETVFHLRRAERAEGDAVNRLLAAHVSHARASRRSPFAGRRFEGLRAIGQAARLNYAGGSRLELRNEAIACLALADLRAREDWPGRADDGFLGVDFDPVSARMARGKPDGSVVVRGAGGTGETLRLPGNGRRAVFVRFSPDGRFLAVKHEVGGRGHVVVWDVARAVKVVDAPDAMHADALDFHPDGGTLAAGRRDGSIVLYDLAGRREPRRLMPGAVPRVLRFDPTGERIAVVSPNSREGVQVRRVRDGTVSGAWQVTGSAMAVGWHPAGRWLAVGGDDGRVRVFDSTSPGLAARTFEGHDGQVVALDYHPGGELLATASWDGTLRLWDARAGRELVRAPFPDARPIRFSRDGRLLGPGHDVDRSWLWEVETGQECRTLPGPDGAGPAGWSVRFLEPEGLLVAAGLSGVRMELPGREGTAPFLKLPGTADVTIAPDGASLLTSSAAGVLRWPVRRPSPTELRIGPPGPVAPLAGFPTGRLRLGRDGTTLAAVVDTERGRVRVVDLAGKAGPVTLDGHPNLERLDLSADGAWLATGTWQGTRVKVWDVRRGAPACELPVEGSAEVVFSPDGGRLLTASGREYALWETGTWRQILRVERSQSGSLPGTAAFSPDGRVLAVALTRSAVQLIDAGSGLPYALLEAPEPRNLSGLGFSPDGGLLAVALNGPRILVWDLRLLRSGLVDLGLDWPLTHGPDPAREVRKGPLTVVVEGAAWVAHMERGEALARAGKWDEASSSFDAALAAGAPHVEAHARRALFLWARGDASAYRDACRELLRRFDLDGVSPRAVNEIAWTCALGAGAVDDHDYDTLLRLARSVAASRPEPNRLNTLGALLFRAGRFADAVSHLDHAVEAHGAGGTMYDALFLAMAHHRLGHSDEARRWLRRGSSPPPVAMFKPDATGDTSWIPRLELEFLRREAAGTVDPAGP